MRAADIGGDAVIEATRLNSEGFDGYTLRKKSQLNQTGKPIDPEQVKQTTRPIFGVREKCAFYARGANFKRSLRIASSIIIGETRLTDAVIEKSFLIEGSIFTNPENYLNQDSSLNNLPIIKSFSEKLPSSIKPPSDGFIERNRSAYSIVADRIRINGRFSTTKSQSYADALLEHEADENTHKMPCIFLGKIRMHGATIQGAMYLSQSIFSSNRRSAVSFTGATIHGSVSFSHSLGHVDKRFQPIFQGGEI